MATFNTLPLIELLHDNGIPLENVVDVDGTKANLVIHYSSWASLAQVTAGAALVAAYDPNNPYTPPVQDVQNRWLNSALHGKTPGQIHAIVQGQIDGWTTLAQAKADLRIWMPMIINGLAWMIFRDQQQ